MFLCICSICSYVYVLYVLMSFLWFCMPDVSIFCQILFFIIMHLLVSDRMWSCSFKKSFWTIGLINLRKNCPINNKSHLLVLFKNIYHNIIWNNVSKVHFSTLFLTFSWGRLLSKNKDLYNNKNFINNLYIFYFKLR